MKNLTSFSNFANVCLRFLMWRHRAVQNRNFLFLLLLNVLFLWTCKNFLFSDIPRGTPIGGGQDKQCISVAGVDLPKYKVAELPYSGEKRSFLFFRPHFKMQISGKKRKYGSRIHGKTIQLFEEKYQIVHAQFFCKSLCYSELYYKLYWSKNWTIFLPTFLFCSSSLPIYWNGR